LVALLLGCNSTIQEKAIPMYGEQELINPVDPAKKAWSVSGTLTRYDVTKKVSLQANFAEPGAYTIQFLLVPPDLAVFNPGPPPETYALIEWSVEGNTISRTVSVSNGSSISGNGQGVRVILYDQTHTLGEDPVDYLVGATVSPGTRPANSVPVYTQAGLVPSTVDAPGPDYPGYQAITFTGDAAGEQKALLAPIFPPRGCGATSVLVTVRKVRDGAPPYYPTPIAEQSVQVIQQGHDGATLASYDPRVYGFVPLLSGAGIVVQAYLLPGDIVEFSVIFGIDG
jgi:hypothetical protein